MLLHFEFSNHRSFSSKASISLSPANLKEDNEFILSSAEDYYKSLPVCLFYGANASGKSNILDVLEYVQYVVRSSHSHWRPSGGVRRQPYKLNVENSSETSRFSFAFVENDVLYEFGFEANDEEFISEWVFAFPKKRKQIWYERKLQEIKFGDGLRGNLAAIKSLMRPNSLFLSVAIQNNLEQLLPVYKFFDQIHVAESPFKVGNSVHATGKTIKTVLSFLKFADVGIVDAKIEKEDVPDHMKKVFKSFQAAMDENYDNDETKPFKLSDIESFEKVSFGHRSHGNEIAFFDLSEESDGTIRLANVIAAASIVLEQGGIFILDELDASLHPILAEKVIELFNNDITNPLNAQLIASTHDTNLLCLPSVRRDQIWFVEKDQFGNSNVIPLTDFSTRSTDNLEKGYLEGRFGAIPFLGSVRQIRNKILEAED